MVGQRRHTLAVEPHGQIIHLLPGQAVNDAGLARVLLTDEAQQLLTRITLPLVDAVTDIWPVEAAEEYLRWI